MSNPDHEQSFISHLIELRSRLLRIVGGILLAFVALSPFSNPIYTLLADPLLSHLPAQSSMIAIDVLSPFLSPLKFTLILAAFLTMPWSLYQVWAFVAPGLYQQEKRLALPIVLSSTLLFYCGMAFAYFVIMPLFFAFLTGTAPQGVAVMTDINHYLNFALVAKRPYIIVGAFVIGMLLTPPDVISQTLLAVPMWLLFEVGVFVSRLLLRRKAEARTAESSSEH